MHAHVHVHVHVHQHTHTQHVRAARHARQRGCARLGGARACACSLTRPHAHMRTCTSTRTRSSARSTPRTPARACTAEAARERAPADLHAHLHASVHARAHAPQHTRTQQCEAHAMRASAGVRGLGGTRARACSYPTCPCACMRTFACTCALGGRVGQKVCDRGPAATVAHVLAARCLPAKASRCVIYAHRVNISCCC